jgi:hypothetical protein
VFADMPDNLDRNEVGDLITAWCIHRHLVVETCLSEPRTEILERETSDDFEAWKIKHAACLSA